MAAEEGRWVDDRDVGVRLGDRKKLELLHAPASGAEATRELRGRAPPRRVVPRWGNGRASRPLTCAWSDAGGLEELGQLGQRGTREDAQDGLRKGRESTGRARRETKGEGGVTGAEPL